MRLIDILIENSASTYEYGCVLLEFNFPEIRKIHRAIKKEDLYTSTGPLTYGIEDEPHVTLLYGLHPEVTLKDIQDIVDGYSFGPVQISNPSLFENEEYSVLKYEAASVDLLRVNRGLKQLPFTSDFPDYKPHLTIAYIKPEKGKYYVDKLKELGLDHFTLQPRSVEYSTAEGKSFNIKINR